MSKASDWLSGYMESKNSRPQFFQDGGDGQEAACVDNSGCLHFAYGVTVNTTDALRLADWIYDTFGEKPID